MGDERNGGEESQEEEAHASCICHEHKDEHHPA